MLAAFVPSLLILGFVLFVQYGLRHLLRYRVTPGTVDLVLLGAVPVARLPLAEIAEVREVSLGETMTPDLAGRWSNRFFGPDGRAVLIVKKAGLMPRLVLTPDRPEAFVRTVVQAIARRQRELRAA